MNRARGGRSGGPPKGARAPGEGAPAPGPADRWALWLLLGVNLALEAALAVAGWTLVKYLPTLPLSPWQKAMFEIGIAAALVAFGVRAILVARRLRRLPSR